MNGWMEGQTMDEWMDIYYLSYLAYLLLSIGSPCLFLTLTVHPSDEGVMIKYSPASNVCIENASY